MIVRKVKNPKVIKRIPTNNESLEFLSMVLKGPHKRVSPETYKDVIFLANLAHNDEKWTPEIGEGIIVRNHIL